MSGPQSWRGRPIVIDAEHLRSLRNRIEAVLGFALVVLFLAVVWALIVLGAAAVAKALD